MVLLLGQVDNLDRVDNTSLLVSLSKSILDRLRLSLGGVKVEEVVGWVVDLMLNYSLQRKPLRAIADLNEVGCFDSDTITILIGLSERLTHTFVVIAWCFSVLHELDSSRSNRGTSLRSIVHHGHSSIGVDVSDRDGRVNWVVVVGYSLASIKIPGGSVILDSLLHFEAI